MHLSSPAAVLPDRPLQNFRASKSGVRLFLSGLVTSDLKSKYMYVQSCERVGRVVWFDKHHALNGKCNQSH